MQIYLYILYNTCLIQSVYCFSFHFSLFFYILTLPPHWEPTNNSGKNLHLSLPSTQEAGENGVETEQVQGVHSAAYSLLGFRGHNNK